VTKGPCETTKVNVTVRVTEIAPLIASIVITVDENGAVNDAVKVTVAEQVTIQGLFTKGDEVTPTGRLPKILKVTGGLPPHPETNVAVAVSTPPGPPGVIVRVEGLAPTVKSKPPQITSVKVVAWVPEGEPPVAWIVTTVDDAGAVVEAVRVTVALHIGLHGLLVNADAATPVGSVLRILNVTGVEPAPAASVAVAVSTPPGPPGKIAKVAGDATRLKSKHWV